MMGKFEIPHGEGLAMYDRAIDESDELIARMGLSVAQRPTLRSGDFAEYPALPPDLGEYGFREIGLLLGTFTAWYDYAIGQHKTAVGRRNVAEKKRAFSWAKIRQEKTGTVSDKDDQTRIDERFVSVDYEYEMWSDITNKLQGIVDGLKRDIDTISRVVATIEGNIHVHGREGSINRKRYGARPTGSSERSGPSLNRGVLSKFRAGTRRG